MHRACLLNVIILALALSGCSGNTTKKAESPPEPAVSYFKVDPATAGTLKGKIQFTGQKPAEQKIDMDEDPQCARMHKGAKVSDESLEVNCEGRSRECFRLCEDGSRRQEIRAARGAGDDRSEWMLVQAADYRNTNRPDAEGNQLGSCDAQYPSAGAGESGMEP